MTRRILFLVVTAILVHAASLVHARVLLTDTKNTVLPTTVESTVQVLPNPKNLSVEEYARQPRFLAAVQASVQEYQTLVNNVIQEFCFANTNRRCNGVDIEGNDDWFRAFDVPSLSTELNNTVPSVNNDGEASVQTFQKLTCAYDPVAPTTCRLDGQTVTSNEVTASHTATHTYEGQIGYNVQIKGGVKDVSWEQTFDFSYSTSTGKSTARLDGETTVASVSVPMTPDDPRCTVINVVLRRVKQSGNMAVFVRSKGWIGVHQDDWRDWKHLSNKPTEHSRLIRLRDPKEPRLRIEDRAFSFPWLVRKSQELGRPTSRRWVVENDGWAYMYTPIRLQFDVAVAGYANPQRYPKDDPRCRA